MLNPLGPAFGGKYLVQVPREAFKEPKNLKQCEQDFEKKFAEEYYKNVPFFQIRKKPYYAFLEAPLYPDVIQSTTCGPHWIAQHTGINIKRPFSPDYHSFLIVTDDEGRALRERIKPRHLKRLSDEINEEQEAREEKGLCADEVWELAKTQEAFCKILDEATENSGPQTAIILNGLDDIPYAVSEMED